MIRLFLSPRTNVTNFPNAYEYLEGQGRLILGAEMKGQESIDLVSVIPQQRQPLSTLAGLAEKFMEAFVNLTEEQEILKIVSGGISAGLDPGTTPVPYESTAPKRQSEEVMYSLQNFENAESSLHTIQLLDDFITSLKASIDSDIVTASDLVMPEIQIEKGPSLEPNVDGLTEILLVGD